MRRSDLSSTQTVTIRLEPPYPPGLHPDLLIVGALYDTAVALNKPTWDPHRPEHHEDDLIDLWHVLFEAVSAGVNDTECSTYGTTERMLAQLRQVQGYANANALLDHFLRALDRTFIIHIKLDPRMKRLLKHPALEVRS